MSTAAVPSESESAGFPELTALGKRVEVLRIGRGISKQHLARFAGTSRQQLWRVMTGKSELTDTLGHRLAQALGVETAALGVGAAATSTISTALSGVAADRFIASLSVEAYLATPEHAERTLTTLPNGEAGRELKRALLNALEDQALRRELPLPSEFFDLRRRVLAGDL